MIGIKKKRLRSKKEYYQKNHRIKFPEPKEVDVYQGMRGIQKIKRQDQKRNFFCHILMKTLDIQNKKKEKTIKSFKGKRSRNI